MDKHEIIKLFLERGLQIDPQSLELFYASEEKMNRFLKNIADKKISSNITMNFVKSVLGRIEVLQNFITPQKKYTTEDAIQYFNNRYEAIKKFFVDKPGMENLISINKIPDNIKKFSIIAMVKEKDVSEKTITVEDQTGEILVLAESSDFQYIVQDEIIGLSCEKIGAVPIAKNIIFPDIPLKREVNRTEDDVFCLFISDFHFESEHFNKKHYEKFLEWIKKPHPNLYIFVASGVSSDKQKVSEFFSQLPEDSVKIYLRDEVDAEFVSDYTLGMPCLVKIDGVAILLCNDETIGYYVKLWGNITVEKVMLELLKKRHINPTFVANKRIYDKDPFILETLPDIFVSSHFHKPGELNYKGTTILSLGSFTQQPIFWLVNLKTREIIKLDFT